MSISSIASNPFAFSYAVQKKSVFSMENQGAATPIKLDNVVTAEATPVPDATPASIHRLHVKKDDKCTPGACFGDLNGDGQVNMTDLAFVLSKYGSKGGHADINRDGEVDQQDVDIVLGYWGMDVSGKTKSEATAKDFGDVNADGKVDLTDLATVLSDCGTDCKTSDINGDGKVDQRDVKIVLGYWGTDVDRLMARYNRPDRGPDVVTAEPVKAPVEATPQPVEESRIPTPALKPQAVAPASLDTVSWLLAREA
mgnify:CR=1 FL=1